MTNSSFSDLRQRYDIAAWILAALALVMVIKAQLLAALFGGLLVHELVQVLVPVFRLTHYAGKRAKLLAVAILSALVIGILFFSILWIVGFVRSGSENLPHLVSTMAEIIEQSRDLLPAGLEQHIPLDLEEIKQTTAGWLRSNAGALTVAGEQTLRTIAQLLIGMVVGAMVSLREAVPGHAEKGGLARALIARVGFLGGAFQRVVFAQVRIAGLNAFLTWLYLGVTLPLLDIHLPYTKTLILVTFVVGLLPVIGNLVSNTIIVTVSLSHSLGIALASLGFLVVIHKLEYFLNAHIIASRIRARPWELLVAMLVMEALFGFRGLVAAPVFYAYIKDELSARSLL